ncbi:MAG: hypothetical protein D6796_06155, partial [Caldilineae bacterium]
LSLVTGPGMEPLPPDALRGEADIPADKLLVELVETNGLRHWQILLPQTGQPLSLPGSAAARLPRTEAARQTLGLSRGVADYLRVIGRWLIGQEEGSLLESVAEQYDRDMVPQEQLLRIAADGSLSPLGAEPWWWLDGNVASQTDRVLLLIHGTFSKTASPVKGLGSEFLEWANRHYRGVIGFDHWTLSRTPDENARLLWNLLDERLKKSAGRLDIITHSRGGLVARAFVELLRHHKPVNRIVFVCTPNGGTALANPQNWGRAADALVNLIHLDSFGLFGRMSGLLARLSALGAALATTGDRLLRQVPGLYAQNPAATGPRDFLGRLQRGSGPPEGVAYAAVAVNYEPPPKETNIHSLAKQVKARQSNALDEATDILFANYNDLVVDTPRVWAVDLSPDVAATAAVAPAWLPPARLLIYNPDEAMPVPPGATVLHTPGVHHTNVFYFPATRQFLRQQLSHVQT